MRTTKNFDKPTGIVIAILAATAAAFAATGDLAAQTVETAPPVIVTATRSPTDIEKVGSSVTVITADDIERHQYRTVTEALESVPGLRTVQLGTFGQQTSVFSRGANSNQTLVLIDGIEATDPSSVNGSFNFANLMIDNTDRIEVVRGAQSTLYGSQAIGGVVNIITKKGKGKPHATMQLEGGSHGEANPALSVSGSTDRLGYSASASYFRTDGESVSAPRVRPAGVDDEADKYENFTASTRLDATVSDTVDAALIGRFTRSDTDVDLTVEDPNSRQTEEDTYLRLASTGHFFDEFWEPTLSLDWTRNRRHTTNDPDSLSATFERTENTGGRYAIGLQNDFHLTDTNTATLGFEYKSEQMQQNTRTFFPQFSFTIEGATDENVDNRAVYLQDKFAFFDRLFGTVGVRYDDHQSAGGKATWRVTPIYHIKETDTRLKASYGTGYRAPALFELYGKTANNFGGTFNGNPDLLPEESHGGEAGFEQGLFQERISFGAVYFWNRTKNLIVCSTTTCSNVGRSDAFGVETSFKARITDTLSLAANYTYTRTEDLDTHSDLLRRPKHTGEVNATWRPIDKVSTTAGLAFVGRQRDVDFTTGGNATTPGHAVVNLAAEYKYSEQVSFYARATNLLDHDYEVADGFQGPGRNVFIGGRLRF